MDDRAVAMWYSSARVVLGTAFTVAPGILGGWIGEDSRRPATRVLARAFGVRDAVLGVGALLALREGAPARRWLQLAAAADLGDAVASLLAARDLPTRKSVGAAVAGCLGAATGARLAARLT